MSSCYEFICYGCEGPSDTLLCYLCTCEQCGKILIDGTCSKCNSGARNSFVYDPNPKSFNEVQSIFNQSEINIHFVRNFVASGQVRVLHVPSRFQFGPWSLRTYTPGYVIKRIGNPQQKEYKEKGVIDSGCSRHMRGNKCYLTDYEDYDGEFVSFGDGKGRISGKGKIKTRTLDFDDVYFYKELKYNMF
nr:hypothetical protein [Tanacetum cinerariifolium]